MIRLELDRGLALLTLDRGAGRNAMATVAWTQLGQLAQQIARNPDVRVVIVQSAMPGMFSAGADLAEFAQIIDQPDCRTEFRQAMAAGITALTQLPMPVIAAVDGGCYGAGVALALACDLVVAGDQALFCTPPAKMGISYPASDVARIRARVGPGHAARMFLLAQQIGADDALRIGLVDVRAENAGVQARDMAQVIHTHDQGALALLKSILADPTATGHDAAFEASLGSPGFARRLDAFFAGKR